MPTTENPFNYPMAGLYSDATGWYFADSGLVPTTSTSAPTNSNSDAVAAAVITIVVVVAVAIVVAFIVFLQQTGRIVFPCCPPKDPAARRHIPNRDEARAELAQLVGQQASRDVRPTPNLPANSTHPVPVSAPNVTWASNNTANNNNNTAGRRRPSREEEVISNERIENLILQSLSAREQNRYQEMVPEDRQRWLARRRRRLLREERERQEEVARQRELQQYPHAEPHVIDRVMPEVVEAYLIVPHSQAKEIYEQIRRMQGNNADSNAPPLPIDGDDSPRVSVNPITSQGQDGETETGSPAREGSDAAAAEVDDGANFTSKRIVRLGNNDILKRIHCSHGEAGNLNESFTVYRRVSARFLYGKGAAYIQRAPAPRQTRLSGVFSQDLMVCEYKSDSDSSSNEDKKSPEEVKLSGSLVSSSSSKENVGMPVVFSAESNGAGDRNMRRRRSRGGGGGGGAENSYVSIPIGDEVTPTMGSSAFERPNERSTFMGRLRSSLSRVGALAASLSHSNVTSPQQRSGAAAPLTSGTSNAAVVRNSSAVFSLPSVSHNYVGSGTYNSYGSRSGNSSESYQSEGSSEDNDDDGAVDAATAGDSPAGEVTDRMRRQQSRQLLREELCRTVLASAATSPRAVSSQRRSSLLNESQTIAAHVASQSTSAVLPPVTLTSPNANQDTSSASYTPSASQVFRPPALSAFSQGRNRISTPPILQHVEGQLTHRTHAPSPRHSVHFHEGFNLDSSHSAFVPHTPLFDSEAPADPSRPTQTRRERRQSGNNVSILIAPSPRVDGGGSMETMIEMSVISASGGLPTLGSHPNPFLSSEPQSKRGGQKQSTPSQSAVLTGGNTTAHQDRPNRMQRNTSVSFLAIPAERGATVPSWLQGTTPAASPLAGSSTARPAPGTVIVDMEALEHTLTHRSAGAPLRPRRRESVSASSSLLLNSGTTTGMTRPGLLSNTQSPASPVPSRESESESPFTAAEPPCNTRMNTTAVHGEGEDEVEETVAIPIQTTEANLRYLSTYMRVTSEGPLPAAVATPTERRMSSVVVPETPTSEMEDEFFLAGNVQR